MKKLFAFLILSVVMLSAQQRVSPREKQAWDKIVEVVVRHPEPLVSRDLRALLERETVLFTQNNLFPEMNSSLEDFQKGQKIMLWYNQDFILDVPAVSSPEDKLALLRLIVYHEAVHIDDHVKGRHFLFSVVQLRTAVPKDIGQRLWDSEWSAVTAEWALAKKWKVPYLVPVIHAATEKADNPRSFLDGFYQLQMAGNAVKLDQGLRLKFTEIYRQKKSELGGLRR